MHELDLIAPEEDLMSARDEVLAANEEYAGNFEHGNLPMPPARRVAVLTCMDARLDPAQYAGLGLGEAHVIRNAGGRASEDAIRSLVISAQLLGTNEWFVVHHTDCGMETFTNDTMVEKLGDEAGKIDWLTISDREGSVREDVQAIKEHPLVPDGVTVHGFVYDVRSGRLVDVE
jgi:carbonic anhydrase